MGYQYGKKLAAKIYTLTIKEKASIYAAMSEEQIKKNLGVEQFFADKYNPAFREWQQGISDGCKEQGYDITVEDLLLIAMFTSIFYTIPGGAYPEGFGLNGEKLDRESEIPERHFSPFRICSFQTIPPKRTVCSPS